MVMTVSVCLVFKLSELEDVFEWRSSLSVVLLATCHTQWNVARDRPNRHRPLWIMKECRSFDGNLEFGTPVWRLLISCQRTGSPYQSAADSNTSFSSISVQISNKLSLPNVHSNWAASSQRSLHLICQSPKLLSWCIKVMIHDWQYCVWIHGFKEQTAVQTQ